MMQKKFRCYSDPGHAWLKVPLTLLFAFEIHDKISTCSYMRKEFAYLEENRDMQLFLKAYKDETGESAVVVEMPSADKGSKIRGYASYDIHQAKDLIAWANVTTKNTPLLARAKAVVWRYAQRSAVHQAVLDAMKTNGNLHIIHIGSR